MTQSYFKLLAKVNTEYVYITLTNKFVIFEAAKR